MDYQPGDRQPLYPWKPGDWRTFVQADLVKQLLLPLSEAGQGYESWQVDTPAGMETIVLLADEQPLPPEFRRLPHLLTGFPQAARLPDPERVHWFECRDRDCLQKEKSRLSFTKAPVADPVYQIQTRLRETRSAPYVDPGR